MEDWTPWKLIGWIIRQAPIWRARLDGLRSRDYSADSGGRTPGSRPPGQYLLTLPPKIETNGRLANYQADYYELACIIERLRVGHEQGEWLHWVVTLYMVGNSFRQIARQMKQQGIRRGGRKSVRDALHEGFRWICHPEEGGWLTREAWEAGE